MYKTTPEYVSIHLQNLSDKPPKAGPELVARYRRERRARIRRLAANIYHSLPLRHKEETAETSNQAHPAT